MDKKCCLILCWWLCLLVYKQIYWKMVCWYFGKEIPYELLGICKLVLSFPKYEKYFVRSLRLLKSMYGMTNSGKLSADNLIEWLLEAGLFNINVRCLSIISMHEMDQKCSIILCWWLCLLVYKLISWKWSVVTLGQILHVNFVVYAHWFMSIIISQMIWSFHFCGSR